MNDRDIMLIIENWINEQKKEHFIVNFKELDSILSLPNGSTERNIKVAADKAGFDIDMGSDFAALTLHSYRFFYGLKRGFRE